ncbi:MAG: plasmid mobilization relaxosome protein MobC [Christensenellales bacterium]|nr:plasmid mobilization relaxosome protein MobC [Christensenellales bacterium]
MAEKEKRLVNHNFRTTESEAAIMRKKMDALGIKNESAYMRALALNGYILKLDLPQIREMLRLLGNMTNNLNQIAKRLNAHGNLYETEIEEIQQKQDELWKMMRQLLSILERTG